MSDEKPKAGGGWHNIGYAERDPNDPPTPHKTRRPKRRRKGELNDGQWAPGVKPKPKRE